MRVLVVGGGGREHALAWSLARSPRVTQVLLAPGNAGTAARPGCANVPVPDGGLEGLVALAQLRDVQLVVVGPEAPLAAGLADRLRAAGLAVFGPGAAAARLESSKAWARDFMARHDVPHPQFTVVTGLQEATRAVGALGGRCVVKADGLAAGKGVLMCDTEAEAVAAAQSMLVDGVFGPAGARLVVEERLEGPELSVMAITDGRRYTLLPPAQDHKRLLDGDAGPNTGGMGAYAPAPAGTEAVLAEVARRVIEPTLAGMAAEGTPYTGCLYCGLILTPRGPVVIEFNCRFGDPETQAQLPLVTADLAEVLLAAAAGDLGDWPARLPTDGVAACVVLASAGYPTRSTAGQTIHGLQAAAATPGLTVFHAGTRAEDGHVVTAGGRVLNVVCVGEDLPAAVAGAYAAIGPAGVHFDGMQHRTDIAHRAL